MVYSRSTREGRRTIILGRIVQISPTYEIDHFNSPVEIFFTRPNNLKINNHVRIFGVFRNGIFVADGYHQITQKEFEHFRKFRKIVRNFYKEKSNSLI